MTGWQKTTIRKQKSENKKVQRAKPEERKKVVNDKKSKNKKREWQKHNQIRLKFKSEEMRKTWRPKYSYVWNQKSEKRVNDKNYKKKMNDNKN